MKKVKTSRVNPMTHEKIVDALSSMQKELAEIKGMLKVHMQTENIHHNAPCTYLSGMNKNICTIIGAVVLAILSGLGALVLELLRR